MFSLIFCGFGRGWISQKIQFLGTRICPFTFIHFILKRNLVAFNNYMRAEQYI